MKVQQCFAPTILLVALSATQAVFAGIYLPVINSTFSNVSVQCSGDYALQSTNGGTCTSLDYPQQAFDGTTGIGWRFSLNGVPGSSSGLTGPSTSFNPPSFLGFPFTQAFLQGADYGVAQTVGGFEAGATYRLAFYLGSRYANGDSDGNQTVVAYIDYHLLDVCTLVSD